MNFDPLYYPYASKRLLNYASRGMVATSQTLAAQAGLDILKKGGNAIDAAIATAACLTVVEPTSNGIGGDAFALVWTKGQLHGLNASGTAPASLSGQALIKKGYNEMPQYGWIPVTVPGAPSAWAALAERFGRLPLTETLKPAIEYAEQGYPVSPILGHNWQIAYEKLSQDLKGEEYASWFETFAPQGRAPLIGEIWRSPDHAQTLTKIAESNAQSFYKGELAEKIDAFSQKYGGYLRKADLEEYQPLSVDPIHINYRGYDVWEIPPNGHGLVALMALNILKGFDFTDKDCIETYHKQIEAIKLAYVDGRKYIADPRDMEVKVHDLLSEGYALERRKLIGKTALLPEPGTPPKGGTVYLATADNEGNMVSMIQSNYMDFGSGLVVPGTGISLHNRGNNFSLDPQHVNFLGPRKRPYHTIIPGFLTKAGKALGPFGVMGGFMQPQGHVQVLMNAIDFNLNPQAALDAPRFLWNKDRHVQVERSFPHHIADALCRMGHDIEWSGNTGLFGRGQIVWRNENDVLMGATEQRTDGVVATW
ncbi:gamma-glutamyltransferase 2 [Desulfitobacterium dichloroeliminans LMG P-21439]|uniref:Gamma-glutamyltransferase 2 n=1 Tax=Desulfitobacterium dichloroeliminans (strain LMG P-21439 / DCA1) TaxID=871963 RepID=L0F8L2_DESDL|nr:gamma-glutamyltransferase family protein [Desulfitobacterium dichloroeliminans]AGA70159.1 gamma-glutamyltransferase 2 [Desulfitobacterium dichloroeliminans LMG P-21439]